MSIDHVRGSYRFLKGGAPYSSGVMALPGHEIVHATLASALPWQDGLALASAHISSVGRDRMALCAVELRCPAPYTIEGFTEFNQGYCEMLESWGLFVDGLNPVARTNVAPVVNPPSEPMVYAFSYVMPCDDDRLPTLVISGAGELASRTLAPEGIVRKGETTPDAMIEKAHCVMGAICKRLQGLGATWDMVRTTNVYTAHPIDDLVRQEVLPELGRAAQHGIHWYVTRPPVVDIEFEMDVRAVRREVVVG